MSAVEAYCRAFEDKLGAETACCLPAPGTNTMPRCLGAHVRAASDPDVGALYAVYWGAKTGCLSAHDVAGAARHLHDHDTLEVAGLGVGDACSGQASCMLENLGLEFYAGSIKDRLVMRGGVMTSLETLVSLTPNWASLVPEEEGEAFWSNLGREVAPGYIYTTASVGNFASYRRDVVDRVPVEVRVCRGGGGPRDMWIEYVDRTERLYRFRLGGAVLAGVETSAASLACVVIMDAMYRGYRHDGPSVRMLMKETSYTRSSMYAWNNACLAADGRRNSDLVVAVMPCLPDSDAVSEANDALVHACAMYLSSRGGPRRKSEGTPGATLT